MSNLRKSRRKGFSRGLWNASPHSQAIDIRSERGRFHRLEKTERRRIRKAVRLGCGFFKRKAQPDRFRRVRSDSTPGLPAIDVETRFAASSPSDSCFE